MAEITISNGRRGTRRSTPRLDLTPMVDLGFLLITFFIYTTTLARPNAMTINMPLPAKDEDRSVIIDESAITLIPVRSHQVVYYEGALKTPDQMKMVTITGLRSILLKKKTAVAALPATYSRAAHNMYVLIKPGSDCSYGDIVSVLDEMNIIDAPYYTIVDLPGDEARWNTDKFK